MLHNNHTTKQLQPSCGTVAGGLEGARAAAPAFATIVSPRFSKLVHSIDPTTLYRLLKKQAIRPSHVP